MSGIGYTRSTSDEIFFEPGSAAAVLRICLDTCLWPGAMLQLQQHTRQRQLAHMADLSASAPAVTGATDRQAAAVMRRLSSLRIGLAVQQ
jgi:hypothetical protein